MATVLSLTLFLALIGAGMPVSLLSMIWGEISENMIFAASMAGALRAALAFGAVLACIFEGRVREKVGKIDLLIVGMLFEALSLVGYSLSRVFGHLMVWSLLEGFGSGLVLIDVCLILSVCTFRRTALIFTGSPLGIAAGAFVLSFLGERDLSWRTKCQLSGFLILFVTVAVFYLRRRYRLSDFGTKLQKCSGDSTAPGTVQTVLFCGAGLLLGTLEAMTVLWSIRSGSDRHGDFDAGRDHPGLPFHGRRKTARSSAAVQKKDEDAPVPSALSLHGSLPFRTCVRGRPQHEGSARRAHARRGCAWTASAASCQQRRRGQGRCRRYLYL